ncbi:hypothetical protein BCR32DRAFT_293512 [Anaeromyces robustus]|uniref:Sequence orphan n=1 Tax=Anaeromyces robustus TaxID=1754192 RepID=A0A1Y1X5C8_9FUNG|nr:hypothetical protein BCR32DRAFT_293512 [Anaeromyces robustus]|eukprot:ORX81009.1 hypothetical protein BCR32DRAFT_293512 [Anaeromyces robustus]
MKYNCRLYKKWPFISLMVVLPSIIFALPITSNVDCDDGSKKMVQRYNIDVINHRVKSVEYVEFQSKNENENNKYKYSYSIISQIEKENDENYENDNNDNHQPTIEEYLNYINIKTKEENKTSTIRSEDIIELSNEDNTRVKKDVNLFNFHLFCIESTKENCEKIHDNLNDIGISLSKQIIIEEPINILVKSISFCNKLGKDCGSIKNFATSTPTAFYSIIDTTNDTPYLYPQALVKQLDLNGSIEFLKYDMIITINSDINYWFWSDKNEIGSEQIDFQHTVTHKMLHGLGIISGLSQSFKKDQSSIFNVISHHKDHPYLLPYIYYGVVGNFDSPIIKDILPLFVFDKYLKIIDPYTKNKTPVSNYMSLLYESKLLNDIKNNYISLSIKKIEDNYEIFEGLNYLFNYAENSQWIFDNKENNDKYIPIETWIFNDWINGLSGSHIQCNNYFHTARNKDDGLMCTFIEEGVQLIDKYSKLLGDKELMMLSTLGWKLVTEDQKPNNENEYLFDEDEIMTHEDKTDEIEEELEDEMVYESNKEYKKRYMLPASHYSKNKNKTTNIKKKYKFSSRYEN